MVSEKKTSGDNEVVSALLFAAAGVFVAIIVLPATVISLPLAIMLRGLLDEDKSLSRYSFGLVIGFIFYFFMFGVGPLEFKGLLFGSFGGELRFILDELMSLKPKGFFTKFDPSFPDDVRLYLWFSYPLAVVLSLFLKMKGPSKRKKQRDHFNQVHSVAFKRLIGFLSFVTLPFNFVGDASVLLANKYFTSRLRAQIFAGSLVALFYALLYLTFGSPLGWHIQFGYVLNKGIFIFKVILPWVMNVLKLYFYLGAALFPLVWWNNRERYSFDIKSEASLVTRLDGPFKDGRVRLGKDQKNKDVILTPEMLNHHVHVVGASGFGKTTFLLNIIKEKIESGEGLVFVDLKGDIDTVCEIVTFIENAGRLEDFEFFSISEDFLEVSKGISLFDNGNALEIKDKIMGAFNYDHEYYKKRIESFLTLSLRALVFLRDKEGESFDLSSIYKLILGFEHIEELASKVANTEIKQDLESLILDKKLKEDLTGLRADIEGLIKTDFGHLFSKKDGINFYNSMRSSKIVFIHLDSQRYEASAEKLGRLILQDIKTASAKIVTTIPKHDRDPFTLIVDEFANLATEQFVGFLNRARASGIGIVIAHQELSDLDVFSPVVKDQIMTNTSTMFSFLQKLPASAEMISGIAGTYQTEKETHQINEEGLFFKSQEKTGMGSLREVEEYIIHPNLIKELGRGECFMISKYPFTRIAKVFVNHINEPIMDRFKLVQILKMGNSNKDRALLDYKDEAVTMNESARDDEDWL